MPFAPLTSTPERTTRRLLLDAKEVAESAHLVDISAAPLENNLFEWHGNLWFGDAPLHFALFFPDNYPTAPPTCALASRLPHPNVSRAGFEWSGGFEWSLCLDLLEPAPKGEAAAPYTGWSSAYSVHSILLQLQAFLSDPSTPKYLEPKCEYGSLFSLPFNIERRTTI